MQLERPMEPKGKHVTQLRHHLGINQTWFAALRECQQTNISLWEHVDKREEVLPALLSERFLEVWDCFPTKPKGGYTEAMATVSACRMRKAGVAPQRLDVPPPGFVVLSYPEGKTGPRVLIEETGPRLPEDGQQPPQSPTRAPTPEVPPLQSSSDNSAGAVRSNSRAAGRFTTGFALAAGLAVFSFATGCMLSHREPSETDQYLSLPGQIYTDNATDRNGEMGTAQKSSIPMPPKAFSWQKGTPCEGAETEKVGGCWQKLKDQHPPCPEYTVESEGECLIAIPAKPKRPSTVTPAQK